MAKIACGRFKKIIITTPGTFKVSYPQKVYEAFAAVAGEKTQLMADTQEAVQQAIEFAREKNCSILGTGSFYLVSEIRGLLEKVKID